MGWNWKYEDGEKKYYKPKFDFPTRPTSTSTTTTEIVMQETSLNSTIDDIVTSVKEIVTEFASEQAMDVTTPITANINTNSGIIEAVTTVNSTIIEEMVNSTIIQEALTTTESVVSTNSILRAEEPGTTILNEFLDEATTVQEVDWMVAGTENMFFNHNLTMTHQEFEESSQKMYIILGLILAVLIIILIFIIAVYKRYKKTTIYEMEEGHPVRKNRVVSKTSEACYGNESVLIETNEPENYKF